MLVLHSQPAILFCLQTMSAGYTTCIYSLSVPNDDNTTMSMTHITWRINEEQMYEYTEIVNQ